MHHYGRRTNASPGIFRGPPPLQVGPMADQVSPQTGLQPMPGMQCQSVVVPMGIQPGQQFPVQTSTGVHQMVAPGPWG